MRKLVLSVLALLLVCAAALYGASVLFHSSEDAGDTDDTSQQQQVEDVGGESQGDSPDLTGTVQVNPETATGIHKYDNGMASFSYDAAKLMFQEMPSDDESGYPMTSFLPANSDDVLPRVDIIPLVLDTPFDSTTNKEEWESLVKTLVLAYYAQSEWESVSLVFDSSTVKVEDGGAKMFARFSTKLDGSATPNLTGAIRLISNEKNAVVSIALTRTGNLVPQEMTDLYMSASLH